MAFLPPIYRAANMIRCATKQKILVVSLAEVGIAVESVLHAATVHGFDLIFPTEISRDAIAQRVLAARAFVI